MILKVCFCWKLSMCIYSTVPRCFWGGEGWGDLLDMAWNTSRMELNKYWSTLFRNLPGWRSSTRISGFHLPFDLNCFSDQLQCLVMRTCVCMCVCVWIVLSFHTHCIVCVCVCVCAMWAQAHSHGEWLPMKCSSQSCKAHLLWSVQWNV